MNIWAKINKVLAEIEPGLEQKGLYYRSFQFDLSKSERHMLYKAYYARERKIKDSKMQLKLFIEG